MFWPDILSLLDDPEVAGGQSFLVVRKTIPRVKGRYGEAVIQFIPATGSVQPAGEETLMQLPEGDRKGEVLIFRTSTPIQLGENDASTQAGIADIVSDELQYLGSQYKILSRKYWPMIGMYTAVATKQEAIDVQPAPEAPEEPDEPAGAEGGGDQD